MNKKVTLAAILAVTLAGPLSGCVIAVGDKGWDAQSSADWEKKQDSNRRKLEQIELGMALSDVRSIMGTADFNELYQQEEDQVQVLYYRTHRTRGDSKTTKDECTPIVLTNGAVTGWGNTALENAVRL
ncbi:DUF3192 domain-containing protein [Ferrimonas balearica]|uniref:DUF3192 domain-containing protein n=1 Tax=Ferrimonas balearica TaxID=44012 RepID=UPI001F24DB91|nr:DUF3192 domain-containing protein [Ferrimonas balearica]MBY6018144.1 DUF3192 domain-containing protein [Halomonas denitrificans]MBY6094484.1 DUF3192 domain-containing protein [Ferrimonas balearica]